MHSCSFRPKGGWLVGQAGVEADLFSVRSGTLLPSKAEPQKEFEAVFKTVFGDHAVRALANVGAL